MLKFQELVTADKAANTKANGLWGKMAVFAMQEPCKSFNHEGAKKYFAEKEKEAKLSDKKWEPSGAYRSNKSLIVRAKRLAVPLVNSHGDSRGKTEVQDDWNELEASAKTPYQQFTAAMETATKKFDKLEVGQYPAAAALVGQLATTIRAKITGQMEQIAA